MRRSKNRRPVYYIVKPVVVAGEYASNKSIFEKNWFMWLMIIIFFPAGLYIAWKHHPLVWKIFKYCILAYLITGIILVLLALLTGDIVTTSILFKAIIA